MQLRRTFLWLTLLWMAGVFSAIPAEATLYQLSKVYIVSRYPDESVASTENRVGSALFPVTLSVVVEGTAPGRLPMYFTDAPAINLGRGALPSKQVRPWDSKTDGELEIRWSQLEPEAKAYDNLVPQIHLEPISYQDVALWKLDNQWSWTATVHPTLIPNQAPESPTGIGVGWFKVRVRHQNVELSTMGAAGALAGGLPLGVSSVSYRGDDSIGVVSWAKTRFHMPYIHGASSINRDDSSHQALRGIGGDSIDLLVAAWQLAGHREVDFVGPFLLDPTNEYKGTIQVAKCRPENGFYLDSSGETLKVGVDGILPGDLLRSSKQAGIYARDLPPLGVMNDEDLVISALFQDPRREPLRDLLSGPVTVLRWNEIRELQEDLRFLGYYRGNVDGTLSLPLREALGEAQKRAGVASLVPPPSDDELLKRHATYDLLSASVRFQLFRESSRYYASDPGERRKFVQRVLARAAAEAGEVGEVGFRWTPPRAGLEPALWSRPADHPFRPTDSSIWNLDETVDTIAQDFPISDADRDGDVDGLELPADVLAAAPGIVIAIEQGWKKKKPSNLSEVLGNQVWLYIPRADVLVVYLELGDIRVSLGQKVHVGEVIGKAGRSGAYGARRKAATRVRVATFSMGQHGLLLPTDPARRWGQSIPPHPTPYYQVPNASHKGDTP